MKVVKADENHIPVINKIAYGSWYIGYAEILSKDQIDYMLEMMYSPESLRKQMSEGHIFCLAYDEKLLEYAGFISFEHNYNKQPKTKIHKLYVLPSYQGVGLGKLLMEVVETETINQNNNIITLNMNRYNRALFFYKFLGFMIAGSEDIDIGNGYVMNDYILEKDLTV